MKKIILTTIGSLILTVGLHAQVAKWDHTNFDASGHSQYDCIDPNNFTRHGVSWSNVSGSDGSPGGANCFASWTQTDGNYAQKIQYTFSASSLLTSGNVSGVAFDVFQYAGGPAKVAARLIHNSGATSTTLFDVDSSINSGWNSLDFNVAQSFGANDSFTLEIQGFNSTGKNRRIALDNVTVKGHAHCVPEPSGVALLGLGLLGFVLRKRR